jgi:hypothetical protein
MTTGTGLRRWREGKVRPIPGNSPPAQPVSRGVCSLRRVCDDPFSATPFTAGAKNYTGRPVCVLEGMAESIGPMRSNHNQTLGRDRAASRRAAPNPGRRTRREDHALLIVRDEFRPAIP